MFDKQLIRKYIFIALCIIAIIIAIVFIRRTLSVYQSEAESTLDANLAYWVVTDSLQSDDVFIGELMPGDEKELTFTVSNSEGSVKADVPIRFDAIIETSTNMPLEYEIYQILDDGTHYTIPKSQLIKSIFYIDNDENKQTTEDRVYYNRITIKDFEFNDPSKATTFKFGLNVIFPDYYEDGLNDGEEIDENWRFADLVEHIKITIDAKQILPEDRLEN